MCLVTFPAGDAASVFSPQFLGNVGVAVWCHNVSSSCDFSDFSWEMHHGCISCICWASHQICQEAGCNQSVTSCSRNNGQRQKMWSAKQILRGIVEIGFISEREGEIGGRMRWDIGENDIEILVRYRWDIGENAEQSKCGGSFTISCWQWSHLSRELCLLWQHCSLTIWLWSVWQKQI